MKRELNLFERPLEMCYCASGATGGIGACAPCRARAKRRDAHVAEIARRMADVEDKPAKLKRLPEPKQVPYKPRSFDLGYSWVNRTVDRADARARKKEVAERARKKLPDGFPDLCPDTGNWTRDKWIDVMKGQLTKVDNKGRVYHVECWEKHDDAIL